MTQDYAQKLSNKSCGKSENPFIFTGVYPSCFINNNCVVSIITILVYRRQTEVETFTQTFSHQKLYKSERK